jgi:hypothetical protein
LKLKTHTRENFAFDIMFVKEINVQNELEPKEKRFQNENGI